MKNLYRKLKFVFASLLIFGQTYSQAPDFSLVGFAAENGGTSGGAGGEEVTVNSYGGLKKYAEEKETKYIIKVSGTIFNGADGGSIEVASNKTIIGIGDTALLNGVGLKIGDAENVIIRNLRFTMTGVTTRVENPNVYSAAGDEGRAQILTNRGDCLFIHSSTNVWVDHCEFFSEDPKVQANIDLYDGLLDINGKSAYITISWNYFHDHHKCTLVGSSDKDLFPGRTVTFHHNYYRNIRDRIPLYRSGTAHLFNNYMLETNGNVNSRMKACIRVEKNYYENSRNTIYSASSKIKGKAERMDNKEVNCTSTHPYPKNCKASIPYNYTGALTGNVDSVKIIVPVYAGVGKLNF